MQITTLGRRIYDDQLVVGTDPRSQAYYWIGGNIIRSEGAHGTDVAAIADGYVSITPIHLNMTRTTLYWKNSDHGI